MDTKYHVINKDDKIHIVGNDRHFLITFKRKNQPDIKIILPIKQAETLSTILSYEIKDLYYRNGAELYSF